MFADFLKRLTGPTPEPLQDEDARLALTALLVRVARSDGDYAPQERQMITDLISLRYGLDAKGAADLQAQAETLESEAPDTVRFTRAIKDAVPYDDRMDIVEALWQVVLADGVREAEENALMRMVAGFLGITDRDSALARRRIEQA